MDVSKKRLTIGILAVSNLFAQCCVSLISPFFPIEAIKKGASETMVGLIFSCSELIVCLTSPIFGIMLSHVNPRLMYITGLCVYGCCDVMFGFLNKSPSGLPFIAICLATRMVEALGTAAVLTSSFAIAGTIYPEKISTVYSIVQTFGALGFIIGPVVGGVLYQIGGYGFPFWILGSCVFLVGCVTICLMPQQHVITKTSSQSTLSLLTSPSVCYGALCTVTGMAALSVFFPTFSQQLSKFGLGPAYSGLVMILPAVTFSLTAPLCGVLLDRYPKPLPMTMVGLVGLIIALVFFGPAPFLGIPSTLWIQLLCCSLLGVFGAAASVGSARFIVIGASNLYAGTEGTPYGLISGINQASSCFGTFVGPLLGGILTEHFGFGWSLAIAGCICIVPFLLGFLGLCIKDKRKKIDITTPLLVENDHKSVA